MDESIQTQKETIESSPSPQVPPNTNLPKIKRASKRMILIISILLLILLAGGISAGIFFSRQHDKTPVRIRIAQSLTPTLSPSPEGKQFICKELTEKDVYLDRADEKIVLKDSFHGYELDVTQLPEIEISDTACGNMYYELDMYKRVNNGTNSVARFSFFDTITNNADQPLEYYAKTNFSYIEGEHTYDDNINPVTTSPISHIQLDEGVKGVAWTYKFEGLEEVKEGALGGKYYLIQVGNKIIPLHLFSWTTPSLEKAIQDFDQVVRTFRFTKL